MITRKALGAIALATTCVVPLAAFAGDPTPDLVPGGASDGLLFGGDVGIGVLGVTGHNPGQFGRYNGLNTNGIDVVGHFELNARKPWNSGGTRYYELYGNNLVLQTGSHFASGVGSSNGFGSATTNALVNEGTVGFNVGNQGIWGLATHYRAITYTGNIIDSLYSVNGSQATLNNNLPAWGGATATHPGIPNFTVSGLRATGAMQPVQVGTRRDIVGGVGKYIFGNWTFIAGVRHEHKQGSLEESYFGPWGGTAFPLPVDYDTDRYDATLAYTTPKLQGSIQYTFSHFADNNLFVNLPYPISNSAVPFQLSTAYSTPPSNEAHYLTLMMGSNKIVPLTRVNLNARVGLEKQDDTFAPNTADPNPLGAPGLGNLNAALQGTTANSPNITATVYQVNVRTFSYPTPDLDINAEYGVDGRNVNLNQYKVFVGAEGGASNANFNGFAFVVPVEWLKQNGGGDVQYRILPQSDTKVRVGYHFKITDRSNAQVGHSFTNIASAAVLSRLGLLGNGSLTFDYTDRSGSLNYLTPWSNLETGISNSPAAGPTYSGAYYQAPMTSEAVTARAYYPAWGNLIPSLFAQFRNENFTYPPATLANGGNPATAPITGVGEGIKHDYILSIGPDINYRPLTNVNLHFFYNYERLFFDNFGNGACSTAAEAATPACAGTVGYFQNKDTASTHTVGLSGHWQVNPKLKLGADYTFSYGSVVFGEFNGVFVPNPTQSFQNVTNYPDINSVMQNVTLTATYELAPKVGLVCRLGYASFHNNDWYDTANAIQGAGTSAISILTPGYGAPNYGIGTLLVGVDFKL